MHPKTSSSPLITIIILTILLSLIPNTQCSNDHKFEACAPQSCGNLSSIRYPFWIPSKQESFCGFPNPSFQITCKNQNPVLNISNDDYLITHIDYLNHTFHLANALVYDDNISCPTPLHNISLDHFLFGYPNDNYADFFLFYNCSSLPSALYMDFPIRCAESSTSNKNGTTTSYESFGYFHVELLEKWKYSVNKCQSMVVMPVDVSESDDNYGESLRKMNYKDILRQGFTLNWTTSHDCGVCERSGGRCGFDQDRFSCFCRDKPHSKSCHDGKLSKKKDFIIGVCASSTFILLCILIFLYRRYRKKHPSSPLYASEGKFSTGSSTTSNLPSINRSTYFGVQVFNYKELERATDSFNPLKELGDGGFGTVYHGKLRDGREVAIKRLYENNQRRVDQFMNEVEILAHLRHKNLVTLYGCTPRQSHELLLVYEYVPNGTVADHLHGKQAKLGLLAWPKRLSIAIETASALVYLHATDIIHRDVKTQNILLDKDFSVKVADFGLSRLFPLDVTHVSTAPQGTPGYVDPEYHQCYHLTGKSDVYSFGVVLAELISSKPAVDITRPRQEINLSNMLINKIQNQAMHEFVDPSLGFESDSEVNKEISAVAELAFRCLQSTRDVRPSMEEVLETLHNIKGQLIKDKADVVDIPAADVVMLKGELSPTSPPRGCMPYASA